VIAATALSSFRLGFAEDLATLLTANGPRLLLGAAVGMAFALSGALREAAGDSRPWREIEMLAISTGGAGGGFLLTWGRAGGSALALFAVGAVLGAMLVWLPVRALARPRRWTNVALAPALLLMAGIAALAGTYSRARQDLVAPMVAWLLGSLDRATWGSGLAVLVLGAVLLVAALRAIATEDRERLSTLALLAFGLGVGAAGPLAFVGSMVPLAVRAITRGASPRALLAASVAAGAATVVAVDAVPRLLVGGYDFPWNLAAAVLAIPGFLTWNRARLRREAGPAGLAFEISEIALIAALTFAAVSHAFVLARVIRALT
jgi:iron complex transport system permease protein